MFACASAPWKWIAYEVPVRVTSTVPTPVIASSAAWTLPGPVAGAFQLIAPVVTGLPSSPLSMIPLRFASFHGVHVIVKVPPETLDSATTWVSCSESLRSDRAALRASRGPSGGLMSTTTDEAGSIGRVRTTAKESSVPMARL